MFYYGDFYTLGGASCRATLEIVGAHVPAEQRNRLLDSRPGMIVIMMNPGSSQPVEPCDEAERTPDTIGNRANLVPTCPDDTQLAIADVMRHREIRHARVLNLSDVRNQDSPTFLTALRNDGLPAGDSVFCAERAPELEARLNPTAGIVVCAWGKDRRLRGRATRALAAINDAGLCPFGWGEPPAFMHPSRRKSQWPRWICENWPDPAHCV